MKYAIVLTAFFATFSTSQADYITLNSLNGSDTGYISVYGGLAEDVYIDQFSMSYQQTTSGPSTTLNTFCVDLYHNVDIGQQYAVAQLSASTLNSNSVVNTSPPGSEPPTTVYNNGSELGNIYNAVGQFAITAANTPSGGYSIYNPNTNANVTGINYNDYAAAVQLALWSLVSSTSATNAILTSNGSGGYSNYGSNLTVSNMTTVNGGGTAYVVALANDLIADYAPGGYDFSGTNTAVGLLDAAANGTGLDRGQSVLAETSIYATPAPSNSILLGMGALCGLAYFGWQRRKLASARQMI